MSDNVHGVYVVFATVGCYSDRSVFPVAYFDTGGEASAWVTDMTDAIAGFWDEWDALNGDDGRFDEMALVEMGRPTAAVEEPAALVDRIPGKLERRIDGAAANHRPHGDAVLQPVADDDRSGEIDEGILEGLLEALVDIEAGR